MKLELDPRLGDAICALIESQHGVDVDIVLIVTPRLVVGGQDINPSFVTSLEPDIMEAVVIQLGEQMADSKEGRRTVTGKYTRGD